MRNAILAQTTQGKELIFYTEYWASGKHYFKFEYKEKYHIVIAKNIKEALKKVSLNFK